MKWLYNKNYPVHLFWIFIAVLAISAIKPSHPSDFILEHIMTVIFIIVLWYSYNRFRLSHLSYTLIFIFMLLHTLGAHYTYAEVPYDRWFNSIFGVTITEIFNFSRNHYDRLVHFSFGLLIAYPVREIFMRIANAKGFWSYYFPFDVMMAFSMVYELLEWGVAIMFGGELEMTYLGTQGDIWDAHKDMLLASLGGLITMFIVGCYNYKYKKNFGKDFMHSLDVKRKTPLGEVELNRLKKNYQNSRK